MNEKILLVDDEPLILECYAAYLSTQFTVETASSGAEALALVANAGPYAVLVSDLNMPEMMGTELLERVQSIAPETVRMVLTGNEDRNIAVEAVNKGHIFWFLAKPCPPELLVSGLQSALKQYRLVVAERELLEKTLSGSVKMLTEILSVVNADAFGRGQRIRDHARILGSYWGLNRVWELEVAALLSQIGLATVPNSVVTKMRSGVSMTTMERTMVARVPEFGRDLLAHIPRLEPASEIVYYEDKNYDGTGFPRDDVKGKSIPVGSRMLRILSDLVRHEADGTTKAKAFEIMKKYSGCYDPEILAAAEICLIRESPKQGRPVALADLVVGQVLAAAVETQDGVLIIPAGSPISHIVIRKLHNFTQVNPIREPIYIQA